MAQLTGRFVCLGLSIGLGICLAVSTGSAQAAGWGVSRDASIDVSADQIEYDPSGPFMIGEGHVVIRQGGQEIAADYIRVNTETQDAYARGHVVLRRQGMPVWQGEQLQYNLATGMGDFGPFSLHIPPYRVFGERSETETPNQIRIEQVLVTPCKDKAAREFRMTAVQASLRDQRYLYLRHATTWLGPVPVLYSPFWYRDLEAQGRWHVEPGYRSRLGAFLQTHYTVPIDERKTVRSRTHMNWYQYRGPALGQDFRWEDPEWGGRAQFRVFGLSDQERFQTERDREIREAYLDDAFRYRLHLMYDQAIAERDRFFLDATYLSDPYLLEDFLRREHRSAPQPENRLALTHRSDYFTASLSAHARLNDFYAYHERLPEAQLTVPRVRLGDTPLFYQGEHSAAALRHVLPFDSEAEEFDTVRLDTNHRILYPGRYAGFLSLTPRAGLRLTHYTNTLGKWRTVFRTETHTDEETGLEEDVVMEETVRTSGDAKLRVVGEIGLDASYRAFKVLTERPILWGDGLRHVVEPYADYTWRPEPNVRPAELYPFDEIDRVDLDHSVRVGVRQKLQTRRFRRTAEPPPGAGIRREGTAGGRLLRTSDVAGRVSHPPREILDLVDLHVFTTFRLQTLRDEKILGPLEADARFRPTDRFYVDFDAAYTSEESRLDRFNARAILLAEDRSSLELEYRYRADRRNVISALWTLRPEQRWSVEGFHRFDLEDRTLIEHGYGFLRRHNCVGWGVGVRHEPKFVRGERDDFRVWVQIWLLANPEASLRARG